MKDEMIFSEHGETLVCGKFRVEAGNVFELGRWQSHLGGEDLTYAKDPDQKLLYAYDFYHVAADVVVGYLIGYDRNVLCDTPYAKTYDRVYEVIDFSVDCGELDEHCGELLIAYAKNVARERACSSIVIKHVEKYAAFNRFCEKTIGAQRIGDVFYLPLEISEEVKADWALLRAKAGEAASTAELYFLKAAGFSIGKDACVRHSKQGDRIAVDRKSGRIDYPDAITNFGEQPNVTKGLDRAALYYICLCLDGGRVARIELNKPYLCGDGATRFIGAFHGDTAVLFDWWSEDDAKDASRVRLKGMPRHLSGEDRRELLLALKQEGATKLVCGFGASFNMEMGVVEEKRECLPLFVRLRDVQNANGSGHRDNA